MNDPHCVEKRCCTGDRATTTVALPKRAGHDRSAIQTPAGSAGGRNDAPVSGDRVRMRAQWRHQVTVLTISGDVDATNGGRVHDFATRFVLLGNALILDLSGVEFFSARGISVLIAVEHAYRTADVPWALVPSPIVSRVLQLTARETTLPSATSVPDARRRLSAPTHHRLQYTPGSRP
jgi:anti-anti-sigma factor